MANHFEDTSIWPCSCHAYSDIWSSIITLYFQDVFYVLLYLKINIFSLDLLTKRACTTFQTTQ